MAKLSRSGVAFEVFPSVSEIFAQFSTISRLSESKRAKAPTILIDMPIGLPDRGERSCDREGRVLLGSRACTLFPVPVRKAVYSSDYTAACDANHSLQGRKFSIQMWNIIPKVRELDLWIRSNPELARGLREGHPELAFRRLSGDVIKHSKHSREGELVRAKILNTKVGWDLFSEIESFHRDHKRILSLNDLLDAAVLAVMVKECGKDRVTYLGGGEVDGQGIPMRIAAL